MASWLPRCRTYAMTPPLCERLDQDTTSRVVQVWISAHNIEDRSAHLLASRPPDAARTIGVPIGSLYSGAGRRQTPPHERLGPRFVRLFAPPPVRARTAGSPGSTSPPSSSPPQSQSRSRRRASSDRK